MEEGAKGGDLEKEALYAPQRGPGWEESSDSPRPGDPAARRSAGVLMTSGGTLITGKESLKTEP